MDTGAKTPVRDLKTATFRARELRWRSTEAERRLWRHLRNRQMAGFKFRRQEVIGPWIADFVCLEAKLIVEADGGQHQVQADRDARRTSDLQRRGFRVLRFWNHEILQETEAVLEVIRRALMEGGG